MIPDLVTHHITAVIVSQSKSQPPLTMWLGCTRSSLCPLEPGAVSRTARAPLAEMKASLLPGTPWQRQHNQQPWPQPLNSCEDFKSIDSCFEWMFCLDNPIWTNQKLQLRSRDHLMTNHRPVSADVAPSRPQLPISWCGMRGECMIGTLDLEALLSTGEIIPRGL